MSQALDNSPIYLAARAVAARAYPDHPDPLGAWLRDNRRMSAAAQADALGVSVRSVKRWRSLFGATHQIREAWTPADDAYIRAHAADTAAQIGAALGRTVDAVRKRRAQLGAAHSAPSRSAPRPKKPSTVEALAERLRRDPRPDGEKLHDRITLLKALYRRARRRATREAPHAHAAD